MVHVVKKNDLVIQKKKNTFTCILWAAKLHLKGPFVNSVSQSWFVNISSFGEEGSREQTMNSGGKMRIMMRGECVQ